MNLPCTNRPEFTSDDPLDRQAAATACQWCPRRAQCAADALTNGDTAHVWGGIDLTDKPERLIATMLRAIAGPEAAAA